MIIENALHRNKVGQLPMGLAEPSDNGNVQGRFSLNKCFNIIQKLIIIIFLISLTFGSYMLIMRFFNTNDYVETHVFITSEINKTSQSIIANDIEIILRPKNKSQKIPTPRKRRNIDNKLLELKPKKSVVKFKDNEIQRARKTISEHNVLCNEKNHQDICKDIITKLKSLTDPNVVNQQNDKKILKDGVTENNVFNEFHSSNINPTITSKRETLSVDIPYNHLTSTMNVPGERDVTNRITNSMNVRDPYSRHSHKGSFHKLTDTCLLARLMKHSYPHMHGDFDDPIDYEYGHPHGRYSSKFLAPYAGGIDVPQARELHPQDIEIAMSVMKPEQELLNKAISTNVSFREIECPEGTISCSSGDACIDKEQWCNGAVDCDDVSDELRCDCKSRVDRSRICDGYFDCPFGEDEMGCHGCDVNEFSCGNGNSENIVCFNKMKRCNNIADCPSHKDELDCNMLTPTIHKNPLFAVSNTAGFLHRNFKGDWYAVCKNPYMWAHDACRRETGLIIRPPLIQLVQIDPMLKVDYINTAPGGLVGTSHTCLNSSAVYVTCPDLICGTRLPSTWQKLKEDNAENYLFGRNKRFLLKGGPYPVMFHDNRVKRYATSQHRITYVPLNYSDAEINEIRGKRAEGRVVGGKPSQPAAWPWMAALYQNGKFHCGGVIINQNWIMCAAHCVHKFWHHYYEVHVGMLRRFSFSPQEQNHKVTHVIVNQKYNRSNMRSDLSLLKVDREIQFSRWVRPICLPSPDVAGRDWMWGPSPGTMCTAVGWGATIEQGPDPDNLREVEIPIWERCTNLDDMAGNEICAGFVEGGKDSCQGDSGGPLLCQNPGNSNQWYVAGIVSHGDGCGRINKPGVYTRVSIFMPWIRHHIFSKTLPSIQPKQECPGFRCDSGFTKCLPKKRMCDKIIDCLDGEDEINCESPKSDMDSETIELPDPYKPISTSLHKTFPSANKFKSLNANITKVVNPVLLRQKKLFESTTDKIETITIVSPSLDENYDNLISTHKTTKNIINTSLNSFNKDFAYASTLELATSDSALEMSEHISTEINTNDPTSEEIMTQVKYTSTPSTDPTTEKYLTNDNETINDFINIEKSSLGEKLRSENLRTLSTRNENTKSDSQDVIIKFISNSNISLPEDNEIVQNMEVLNRKESLNNISHTQSFDFDSKQDLNNKIEKIMLSELNPAKIRKKHLIPREFECRRIQQTIAYKHRCDQKPDCEDGTDELHCTCNDYLATFDKKLLCDGSFDCADGQDEIDCFDCEEEQYFCKNSQMCVAAKYVCDGKAHCPFGEDELDCLTLSNGKDVIYDLNGRPEVNLEGYLTNKHNNEWHITCVDNIPISTQEKSATYVCRYLGFSAPNRYLIKYININDTHITEDENNINKREAQDKAAVHFTYMNIDRETNVSRNIIFQNPDVVQNQCNPKITKTCMALFVFCDLSLYTDFDTQKKTIIGRNTVDPIEVWPWAVKLYIDGKYRCHGVLIDLSWALVSISCLKNVVLNHHYLTILLGSHNTLPTLKGPYEQVYQVNGKKEIYLSKVVLLHLKTPAKYSAMAKPMIVSSLYNEDQNVTCVALSQDEFNRTISLFLKEISIDCDSYSRCFIYETRVCQPGVSHEWAGIISCHSKLGWYPAASFVDNKNKCSAKGRINASRLWNLKHELKMLEGNLVSDLDDEKLFDVCSGIRCGRGSCIELNKVCNGVLDCEDGSDESKEACMKKNQTCTNDPFHRGCECPVSQLKCRNGRCISKELFKDGKDDCGDGSDEPERILCADYLSRVMPSRVCDGILHCHDRSDEDPTYCKCFAKEAFKCDAAVNNEEYCVAKDMVCDGVRDCPNGSDERKCNALNFPEGTPQGPGQVIIRSHGVWFAKCYPKQNHTKSELEAICFELGYLSGHAKQLEAPPKSMAHSNNAVKIDSFSDVILNNRTSIKLRNTHLPRADPIFEEKEDCYPLFIECL